MNSTKTNWLSKILPFISNINLQFIRSLCIFYNMEYIKHYNEIIVRKQQYLILIF